MIIVLLYRITNYFAVLNAWHGYLICTSKIFTYAYDFSAGIFTT